MAIVDAATATVHIPRHPDIKLGAVAPHHLWDETDRIFLKPSAHNFSRYSMSLLAQFSIGVGITDVPFLFFVLCNYRREGEEPGCVIAPYSALSTGLFDENTREMSQPFQDIAQKFPLSKTWGSSLVFLPGGIRISVSTKKTDIACQCIDSLIPVYSLVVDVQPLGSSDQQIGGNMER